jgi:tetratricopeptide (TPR) repeat protein
MPDATARDLLERAIKAGSGRDYKKAAELLTAVLAMTDSLPEALLYLGRARYELGEQGRSIDAFRRYLGSGGDPAAGFFFLGRSYLACARPAAAVSCLRRSAQAAPERAPTWALLGAALLKRKRTKAAVDCLEKAVGLAPQDKRIYRGYLNALYARGVRLLAKGDADMARQVLGFAVANGLDGAAIRLWRAKALRELGRVEEAIVDCEAALSIAPGDPSIRWLRAGLLLAAGRQAEALSEFEAIRAQHPGLPALPRDDRSLARLRASVAFKEGRYKEAIAACMPLLRADPKDSPLRAIAAESLRATGELERSKNHWLRAVDSSPKDPELRLGLALALYDLGDYQGALGAVERARKLGADGDEADYYAALCRSRLGEDPETLLPLLQSLVRSRDASGESRAADPRLLFALGEALYRSGRPDLASGWFEKVLVLVPGHELSMLYLISAAESVGDEKGRLGAYEAYLESYPDNAKLRREYVGILTSLGDWPAAARALELGLPYGELGDRSRRLLAVAYRNAGRFREAAVAYRDLLRAEPSSAELLVGLAFCLDRDGNSDFALALLEKAPKAAKASADPWILQGALYARSGRVEAAVDALRTATDRDPRSERAWLSLAALYRRQKLGEFAASCEARAREAAQAKGRPAASPAAGASARPAGKAAGAGRRAGSARGGDEGLADAEPRSRRS